MTEHGETQAVDPEIREGFVRLDAKIEAQGAKIEALDAKVEAQGTELRGAITTTRTELRAEIANVCTELGGEIANLRTELGGEIANLRSEMQASTAETRRHFEVIAESLRGDMRVIGEGVTLLGQRADRREAAQEERSSRIESRVLQLKVRVSRLEEGQRPRRGSRRR